MNATNNRSQQLIIGIRAIKICLAGSYAKSILIFLDKPLILLFYVLLRHAGLMNRC